MLLLLLGVINIFLHEKSHALFFYLITGKQAVINWKLLYSYFRAVIPCRLAEYVPVVLAPCLVTAFFGIVTSILYLTVGLNWVVTAFALSVVGSCIGTIGDLYWFAMIRDLPRDFLIFDHGHFADIFAPQELAKNQLCGTTSGTTVE